MLRPHNKDITVSQLSDYIDGEPYIWKDNHGTETVPLLYPAHNKVVVGYNGFTLSARLSICLSVRLSTLYQVSAL